MRKKIKFGSTLIIMIFLISIAAATWGDSEKKARMMYNQALILLDKHEPLKAEKLLKDIVSEYMDTSVATEAIRTLQMMKSFRTIQEYYNAKAEANLKTLMTAIHMYYEDHKKYTTSINELEEKYGFFIFDKGTTVTIIFADDKNYVAKAFHERGDKIHLVKGPTVTGAGGIREIDKDISGLSDDKGNRRLSFKDLNGCYVDSEKAGRLFMVKGLVINNYADIRSFIKIRSNILDSKGNVVKSKTVYAGNPISDKELRSLSMKEIDNWLSNKSGKNRVNVNILPLSPIPFSVFFNNLAGDMSEFTVEAISSTPVGK